MLVPLCTLQAIFLFLFRTLSIWNKCFDPLRVRDGQGPLYNVFLMRCSMYRHHLGVRTTLKGRVTAPGKSR